MIAKLRIVLLGVILSVASSCQDIHQNRKGDFHAGLTPFRKLDSHRVMAAMTWADVTPPVGVPLAGYGEPARRKLDWFNKHPYASLFKPSTGILDPIRAKVMLLEKEGRRLLFINHDLIAADKTFYDRIAAHLEPLGFAPEDIFMSATHTHAGPGAISQNLFWQVVAVDRFKPTVFDGIVDKTLEAIYSAIDQLQPAYLYHYNFLTEDLQRNRRGQEGVYDPTANALLLRGEDDQWLGAVLNFALHGIALPADNLQYSADNIGAIEREIQERFLELNQDQASLFSGVTQSPVVMLINGAEGDVRPAHKGLDGMEHTAQSFANSAMASISNARPVLPDWSVVRSNVELGRPKLNVPNCLEDFPNLKKWLKLKISLRWAFPERVAITTLKLDDILMFAWPGEPISHIGFRLQEVGEAVGAANVWTMGLTNEHLSYFVTPEEWDRGGYESCANFYGRDGSMKIIEVHQAQASSLFGTRQQN